MNIFDIDDPISRKYELEGIWYRGTRIEFLDEPVQDIHAKITAAMDMVSENDIDKAFTDIAEQALIVEGFKRCKIELSEKHILPLTGCIRWKFKTVGVFDQRRDWLVIHIIMKDKYYEYI